MTSTPVPVPDVFGLFRPWSGMVDAGWTRNWLGVRTRAAIQTASGTSARTTHAAFGPPAASEDFFEWIDVLESIVAARDGYTIVELGAGWGRWLVNAAAALAQLDPKRPLVLVGVEAEPTHFAWMRRHMLDNGLDPDAHVLIQAAVAPRNGRVRFRQGDAAAWYGQAIELDDPEAAASGPVSRLIRWSRNSAANALAHGPQARKVRRVRAVSLQEVLRPLGVVDLVDADIQGAEGAVFEAAARELETKVRRVHIGTHGSDVEEQLRAVFGQLGWECRFDYPSGREIDTDWGTVQFEDGVQSWLNPARSALS